MIKDNCTGELPTDIEGWKSRARYFESLYKIEKLESAKLRAVNRTLAHRLHGRSSEKLNDVQRMLFGIAGAVAPAPLSDEGRALMREAGKSVTDRGAEEPRRRGGGRKKDRFHELPQEVELINPPLEERAGKVWISEEVTEHVEHIPGRSIRHITVRPIWADPKRESPPVIAPFPPDLMVFPGSRYGLNFMINVVIGKYADHLPLYRQAGIDARNGMSISRQARMRIVDNMAHLLISIAEQLRRKILRSGYIQIYETITKLKDPERRGRSHDVFFWGFLAPHAQAVYLKFEPKRREKTLFEFFPLKWEGDVQTDGGGWYASAFPDMPFLRHFECIAHLRRYVLRAMEAHEAQMTPILKDITELYRLERLANKRLKLTHEQRGHFRHLYAKPILKRLQKAFLALKDSPLLEGALYDAVTYAYNRWQHLAAYAKLGNGHINIDQNPIENAFRPTKVGRRNWLFVGHPSAGWRSAVLYSVLGTCKLLNVNPEAYLRWVLPHLAEGTNKTTVRGLLPHDFAALFPEHVLKSQNH